MSTNLSESVLKQKPIIIIIFLSLLIYLFLSFKLNVWIDEVCTIKTISHDSVNSTIKSAINFEGQPPFYFIIAFLWAKISNSEFFLRLLSVLFTVSAGLLLFKLYRNISVTKDWLILILIFANPFMVYIATEIRCYSLVVLLSLLLIHIFQKYYTDQKVPILIRTIFIVTSIAAVNTQYFVSFILLSNAVYLMIKSNWKTFLTYMIDMFFVVASLMWVPFHIIGQLDMHLYPGINIGFKDIISFLPERFNDYIFNRHLFPYRILGYLIQLIIIFSIILSIFIKRKVKNFIASNLYLFVQLIGLSLWFSLVYFKLGNEFLSIRHTAILFPVIFLLFIRSFDYFQNVYFKRLIIITAFSFSLICTFNFYKLFVKDFDVLGCVKYMTTNSKETEPIVLMTNQEGLPFLYYFRKKNETYVLPYTLSDSTGFSYVKLGKALKSEEIDELLSKVNRSHNFWVLNLLKDNIHDKNLMSIDEKLNSTKYSLVADTIIGDPKNRKSFKDLHIRKFRIE